MQEENTRSLLSKRPLMLRFKDCQIRKFIPVKIKLIPNIFLGFYGQLLRHANFFEGFDR